MVLERAVETMVITYRICHELTVETIFFKESCKMLLSELLADGWMNGWIDGRTDKWMDGRTDGWMDVWHA